MVAKLSSEYDNMLIFVVKNLRNCVIQIDSKKLSISKYNQL